MKHAHTKLDIVTCEMDSEKADELNDKNLKHKIRKYIAYLLFFKYPKYLHDYVATTKYKANKFTVLSSLSDIIISDSENIKYRINELINGNTNHYGVLSKMASIIREMCFSKNIESLNKFYDMFNGHKHKIKKYIPKKQLEYLNKLYSMLNEISYVDYINVNIEENMKQKSIKMKSEKYLSVISKQNIYIILPEERRVISKVPAYSPNIYYILYDVPRLIIKIPITSVIQNVTSFTIAKTAPRLYEIVDRDYSSTEKEEDINVHSEIITDVLDFISDAPQIDTHRYIKNFSVGNTWEDGRICWGTTAGNKERDVLFNMNMSHTIEINNYLLDLDLYADTFKKLFFEKSHFNSDLGSFEITSLAKLVKTPNSKTLLSNIELYYKDKIIDYVSRKIHLNNDEEEAKWLEEMAQLASQTYALDMHHDILLDQISKHLQTLSSTEEVPTE